MYLQHEYVYLQHKYVYLQHEHVYLQHEYVYLLVGKRHETNFHVIRPNGKATDKSCHELDDEVSVVCVAGAVSIDAARPVHTYHHVHLTVHCSTDATLQAVVEHAAISNQSLWRAPARVT